MLYRTVYILFDEQEVENSAQLICLSGKSTKSFDHISGKSNQSLDHLSGKSNQSIHPLVSRSVTLLLRFVIIKKKDDLHLKNKDNEITKSLFFIKKR